MARVTMVNPPVSVMRLVEDTQPGRRPAVQADGAPGATSFDASGSHQATVLAGHEEILSPADSSASAPPTAAAPAAAVTGGAAPATDGGGGGGAEVHVTTSAAAATAGSTADASPPPVVPPMTRGMRRVGAVVDGAAPRTLAATGAGVTAVALGLLARGTPPETPAEAFWVFQLAAGAAGAGFAPLIYRLRSAQLPTVVTHGLLPAWVAVVGLPLTFYGLRELLTGHRRPGTTAWSAVWRVYTIMVLWAFFAWTNENVIRPHLATATWPERMGLAGPPRGPRVYPQPASTPALARRVGGGRSAGGGRGGGGAAAASTAAAAAAATTAALQAAVETVKRELVVLMDRRTSKMEELERASEAADTSNKLLERARARLGAVAAEAMEGIVGSGGLDELVVLEGVVTCAVRYRDRCREEVGEVEREIGRVEERGERLQAEVAAAQGALVGREVRA